MNAAMQVEKLSNKIADAIVDLVDRTDGPVTLSQVDREVPSFASQERSTWDYLIEHSGKEHLIWSGMSEAGYAALRQRSRIAQQRDSERQSLRHVRRE